jgi:hypothetical protein
LILRVAQKYGYRLPDFNWLTLRDLEYLFPDDSEEVGTLDADAAFSL